MEPVTLILSLASGALVGFSLGFIGGGGSILATPLLLYVVGVKDAHVAIGTSALAVAANAATNLFGHAKRGNVVWLTGAVFATLGIAGAFAGSTLGKHFPGDPLLFLFALLMIGIGLHMLYKASHPEPPERHERLWLTGVLGFGVGLLSGFFGIGGGFLIVPGLIASAGLPMLAAVGTSLLSVTSFGLTTATNYAISGMIDWEIAGLFVLGGLAGGWGGRQLADRLSVKKGALKRSFAVVILLVAVYMLAQQWSFITALAS